jgi:hypothetical protein
MHSLRSRLIVLWVTSLLSCAAVGLLLVQLYRQSTAAQVGRGEAVTAHACDLIRDRYAAYTNTLQGPVRAAGDSGLRGSLTDAVAQALARERRRGRDLAIAGGSARLRLSDLARAVNLPIVRAMPALCDPSYYPSPNGGC